MLAKEAPKGVVMWLLTANKILLSVVLVYQ